MKQAPHLTMGGSGSFVNEEWRRYGQARRKELVEQDEMEGGQSFDLNNQCPVERYFRLAEKVCCEEGFVGGAVATD
jgi:hypothetical protein